MLLQEQPQHVNYAKENIDLFAYSIAWCWGKEGFLRFSGVAPILCLLGALH